MKIKTANILLLYPPTFLVKVHNRLIDARLESVAGRDGALERGHADDGGVDLVAEAVAQDAQHTEVILVATRLLHDGAHVRDHDGVGRDDERRLTRARVDLLSVYRHGLLLGRLEHVLERRQRLGQVLVRARRDDLGVAQAEL